MGILNFKVRSTGSGICHFKRVWWCLTSKLYLPCFHLCPPRLFLTETFPAKTAAAAAGVKRLQADVVSHVFGVRVCSATLARSLLVCCSGSLERRCDKGLGEEADELLHPKPGMKMWSETARLGQKSSIHHLPILLMKLLRKRQPSFNIFFIFHSCGSVAPTASRGQFPKHKLFITFCYDGSWRPWSWEPTKQRSPEYRAAEWHWESRSGTCGVKLKDFKEHVLYSHMWESKSIMSVLVCKWVGEERTYVSFKSILTHNSP